MAMLNFTNVRLCGRDNEIATLQDAYKRARESSCSNSSSTCSLQVVWIIGSSGTGKSALVDHVFGQAESSKYIFCSGKFEQQRSVDPHSTLACLLFNLWCIIEHDYPDIEIHSDDLKVLSNLLPEMAGSKKVSSKVTTDMFNAEWGLERLKQALRSFIKTICCKVDSPLILYLDDLQWADLDTLSIMEDLLSDPEQSNILFIGSYRDNLISGGTSSPMTRFLKDISSRRHQCVTQIHLTNLDQSSVCEIVAGVLNMNERQAMPLGSLIHQKTEGNCFYALLMIRHIFDQRLMYTSSRRNPRWKWDIEKIRVEVGVSDKNVIDILDQKLASLPQETMNALKMSAFLGRRVDLALLEMLIPLFGSEHSAKPMHDVLDAAVKANLIEMDSDRSHITFSHDRIEATVYAIVAKGKTGPLLHLKIGRFLCSGVVIDMQMTQEKEENDRFLFLATDQLNRGSALIKDDQEKVYLVRLNLAVAKKLIRRGAFQMSLTFLEMALTLFGTDRWEQDYAMTLDLSNTLAFVLLSNGKADACIDMVEEVRLHATCLEDSYVVCNIYLEMLVITNRLDECLEVALDILQEVGYPKVPRKPGLIRHVIPKVISVKRLLKDMSDDDLLNLTPWPDDKKTQKFIFHTFSTLIPVAYYLNEMDLIPLLTCHAIQQTLIHGATSLSAVSFAGYGLLLSVLGDFDGARRFATLANGMMARFGDEPSCMTLVNAVLTPLTNPMQGSVNTTLRAYQKAFSKGDLRYAGQAADFHIIIRFAAGLPLISLAEDGFAFCRQLRRYNQLVMFKFLLTTLRAVVELMACPSKMSEFVGKTLDDQAFEDYLRRGGATTYHLASFWMYAMEARYYLGDMKSALGYAEKVWKSKDLSKGAFVFLIEFHLISALLGFHFWKSTRKRRFWSIFRKHHKALASWMKKGNVNTIHLVALLDTIVLVHRPPQQYRRRDGKEEVDFEKGRKSYEKSISRATRCGFVHHAALANELVGKYCLEHTCRDVYWARFYLENARDQYEDWNATAKVNQMEFEYKFLFDPNNDGGGSSTSSFSGGDHNGGGERLSGSLRKRRSSTTVTGRSRVEIIDQTEKNHTTTVPLTG